MSNIYLVPWGRGKGGSRYIKRTILPPGVGPWTGDTRPPDLGCGRAGLGPGREELEEKAFLKGDRDGVLGSGCLGLSIPPLLSDVLCRLVLLSFFFFFN